MTTAIDARFVVISNLKSIGGPYLLETEDEAEEFIGRLLDRHISLTYAELWTQWATIQVSCGRRGSGYSPAGIRTRFLNNRLQLLRDGRVVREWTRADCGTKSAASQ